jgi:hypothetical protein
MKIFELFPIKIEVKTLASKVIKNGCKVRWNIASPRPLVLH